MKISVNASIYDLQSAFWRSDGYVAVVDDRNKLIGLYGKKENDHVTIDMVNKYDKGILIDEVINKTFSSVTLSENVDAELDAFFRENTYTYAPIITRTGEFVQFAINKEKIAPLTKEYMIKKIIAERWHTYDLLLDRVNFPRIKCLICDNEIQVNSAEKLTCVCLFGGGKLERYVCSHCGAVIGPKKMLLLSDEELTEDYVQHYSIFQEGDTTEDEIRTFHKLNPIKGKKYLNYGCGGEWSKSISILREQGYDVYGYEPFATSSSVKHIITNKTELQKIKFEGIFSNNLLEHLRNPVEELKFMKKLLSGNEATMVHATACYEYLYPYTRFHVCFPVGKSAEFMFNRAGLKIMERTEGTMHGDKYTCVVVR